MRFFKTFCAFSLPIALLFACSATRKGETIVSAEQEAPAPVVKTKIELVEPVGASGKTSWAEYKAGLKSLDEEDDLWTAMQYLELALSSVYAERQADTLGLPEDSLYFSAMPGKIIFALELLYPKLISLANPEQDLSMRNDYEEYEDPDYIDLDSFEETPLDSAEKVAIENFLDTMDLSRFSLPVVINERVMQEIHYLAVNARTFTEGSLSRKTLLDSMIYSKIRERGMPEDLIYLAFVESGFKTSAYSRARAAGVWQFIPGTGKRYGVPSDFWVDMRRNPEAATDAALSYLSDLYNEFGDWHLAMAAYNCGEGRIRRLVKEKLSDNPSKKVSYWDLKLPRETMHYVPRILAATIIGYFPEQYSFTVEKQTRAPYDTVSIKDCLPLDKIGAAVGVSVNTIRDLNPELVRWCTPPNLKSYTLRVPKDSREKFLAAYAKMDKTQLVRWQQYKVQRGDNLGYISRLFGLKVADIQAANNLRNTKLRVGQIIIIPMPAGANPPAAIKQNQTEARVTGSPSIDKKDNGNARAYVVRKGDNLSSISRRFGVSSQNLQTWNNLQGNKLVVGQRIYLQNPDKKEIKKDERFVNAPATQGSSYTIKAGDNLWEIARAHEVTVEQLLEWNPGLDKKIYPGMRIKIKE